MGGGSQANRRVRIHLLGPFELIVDGEQIDVPRSRVRDLLAILAMGSAETSTHDALIDDLWAEAAPKNPRAALRVVLSRARSALGDAADVLSTTPTGIRLDVATDVDDFLAVDASSGDTVALTDALTLWRGQPHASTLPTTRMAANAHHLAERRVQIVVRLGELLVEEGRHSAVLDLVGPEASSDATHEGLARLHATALAGTGRKADALRVLDECRIALRDELGVDPSPAFSDTERSILNDAIEVASVAPATRGERTAFEFVGRKEELAVLLDGEPRRIVVVGEAGIGKSRLVAEAVRILDDEGATVITVSCPNAPVRAMEALGDLLHALPADDRPVAVETATALRRIDPSLAADPGDVVVAPIRREGLVSLIADHIRSRLADHNATLVVDDAHWIDRGSAEVLAAMHPEDLRVILVTRTIDELPIPIGHAAGTTFVELGGLEPNHTEQLVANALGPTQRSDLVRSIQEKSGGNPFFVELLVSLAAEGVLQPSDELPMSALVAVQGRIDRLSGPARQTLLAAAVLGSDIDAELLVLVRPAMERDLNEAVEEGLLRWSEPERRAHFVHALVAQGAYELLAEGQRADLHDRFAIALADDPLRSIEFARHAVGAEQHDPHRSVEALLAASAAHLQLFADDDAVQYARAGLRTLSRWKIHDTRLEARARLLEGRALRWSDGDTSAAALTSAAELARATGDTALLIDATLALCERGRNTVAGTVHEVAASAVDELLARSDLTVEQRARLLSGSSLLFAVSTADDEVRRRFADAITIARAASDDQLEAEILLETDFGLSHPLDFDRRVEAVERLHILAGDDPDLRWEAAWLQFGIAVQTGAVNDAVNAYEMMRSGLDDVRQRPRNFGMAIVDAVVAQTAGELDVAEAWANTVLEEGLRRYPESWAMNAYGALLLGIRRLGGRVGELLSTFESILETNPAYPTWETCVAYSALDAGNVELAHRSFDALADTGFERLVRDGSWTSAVGVLAELAAALDRPDAAATLYDLLQPFQNRMLWSGVSPYGPAATSLAAAAELVGRPDEAASLRRVGEAMNRRLAPLGELIRVPPTPS